jgi:hypothetical protein
MNDNASTAKNFHIDVPLTYEEWIDRQLPEPDRLMGDVFTTTSKVMVNAATGIGKTNFTLALASSMGAGRDFLHWRCHRPAKILFIDGEMSNRILLSRFKDAVRRLGEIPKGLRVLSHQDVPNWAPLNTPEGRAIIYKIILKMGGVDFVIFDNIMSLTTGDMKEEEAWSNTLPLVKELTARNIGQLWNHHTGHDASRGYGTKTREWLLDTVIQANEQKRPDTDVSFALEFPKARERNPDNRSDFQNVSVALVNDEWMYTGPEKRTKTPSPKGLLFLDALHVAFASAEPIPFQSWKAIDQKHWREECFTRNLINRDKPNSARTLFNKHKLELIECNLIGCNEDLAWLR